MEEAILDKEEFVGLVDIFRLLQRWRDERNQRMMADENLVETTARKEMENEDKKPESNSSIWR